MFKSALKPYFPIRVATCPCAAVPVMPHAARRSTTCTCGLVAMTSASHAEGRQFDPGQVYSRDRCAKELHTLLNKCYLCVVLERGTAKSGTRHLRSGTMAPLAQWLERWSYEP